MRIFSPNTAFVCGVILAAVFQPLSVKAFDPAKASVAPTMLEAFELGREALRSGDHSVASSALEYAADQGHILSRWKLAKMYAEGDGVAEDDGRAFQYFSAIADEFADIPPQSRMAPIVSDSFIRIGRYLISGLPDHAIKANPPQGLRLLAHAGSYFGDAKAQYLMGQVYDQGVPGVSVNSRKSIRWLRLAARSDHHGAQAYLGRMLISAKSNRLVQEGLMWMEAARSRLGDQDPVVADALEVASRAATEQELATARAQAKAWVAKVDGQ